MADRLAGDNFHVKMFREIMLQCRILLS